MTSAFRKKQQGLLVLDALVWLGAFLGVIAIASYIITEVRTHQFAENAGKYAAQVALAVRAKIAAEGSTAVTGAQTGTVWLRSAADCPAEAGATATDSYLPICGFPESDPNFGMTISTTITQANPGDPVVGTVTLGPLPPPYDDRYDLLQTMRRAAANAEPAATAAASGTFITVVNEADPAATTAAAAAAGTGSPTLNLQLTVSNNAPADPYIRADGQRAWNVGVTQDVSNSDFIQVGSITATGTAAAAGDVEMARFVDSDDATGNYLLDPAGTTSNLNELTVENTFTAESDIVMPQLNDGAGNFLSNHIIWAKGVVSQGGTVAIHTCPNGTPEIHGSVVALVATDTNVDNSGGSYPDPKNLKGFNLYAETVSSPGDWRLWAKAFIDDESAGYELVPPAGSDWVRINYWTSCG